MTVGQLLQKYQWRSRTMADLRIQERCYTGNELHGSAAGLYADYKQRAADEGERWPLTSAAFGTKLSDRGFAKTRTEHGTVYFGIGLRYREGRERG